MRHLLILLCIIAMHFQLYAQQQVTFGVSTSGSPFIGPAVYHNTGTQYTHIANVQLYTQAELAANGIYPGAVIAYISWKKIGITNLMNGTAITSNIYLRSGTTYNQYAANDTLNKVVATGFQYIGTYYFDDGQSNLPQANNVWVDFIFPLPYTYSGGNLEVYTTSYATLGTGPQYTWTWGMGGSPNAMKYVLNVTDTTYPTTAPTNVLPVRNNIMFTFSNNGGCVGKPSHAIISSSADTVCEGTSYLITSAGTSKAAAVTFQWQKSPVTTSAFTDIQNATDTNYTGNELQPTKYRLISHCDLSGMNDTSNEVTVTVLPIPQLNGIGETHTGLSYYFSPLGNKPGTNLTWYYGDGNSGTANNYTYTQPGTYTVKVVAENICGKDSATLNIQVAWPASVAETESINALVTISPNPANASASLHASNLHVRDVYIFDQSGRKQRENIIPDSAGKYSISVSELADGLYYIYVLADEGVSVQPLTVVK